MFFETVKICSIESNQAAANHPLARLQSNLTTTFSNLGTAAEVTEHIHIMAAANDDDASTIVTDASVPHSHNFLLTS